MARRADPEVRAKWEERVNCQKESGLTVAAFCDQEQCSPGTFHYWRKKLAAEQGGDGVAKAQPLQARPPQSVRHTRTATESPLEILLPNGAIIRLSGSASEAQIARVVRIASAMEAA